MQTVRWKGRSCLCQQICEVILFLWCHDEGLNCLRKLADQFGTPNRWASWNSLILWEFAPYWIPPHEILPGCSVTVESKSSNVDYLEIPKLDHRLLLEGNVSYWVGQSERGCCSFILPGLISLAWWCPQVCTLLVSAYMQIDPFIPLGLYFLFLPFPSFFLPVPFLPKSPKSLLFPTFVSFPKHPLINPVLSPNALSLNPVMCPAPLGSCPSVLARWSRELPMGDGDGCHAWTTVLMILLEQHWMELG